eukprot:gene47005-57562_t
MVSPEKTKDKPKSWRAKLYELESTGSWLDQGTGFVLSELQLRGDEPCLVMLSEEDENKTLLTSRIQSDEMYEKQGENLILWKEDGSGPGGAVDYALSFQESDGCAAVWALLRAVQTTLR